VDSIITFEQVLSKLFPFSVSRVISLRGSTPSLRSIYICSFVRVAGQEIQRTTVAHAQFPPALLTYSYFTAVLFRGNRQSRTLCVATSSTEAEYIASSEAAEADLWIEGLLAEI